MVVIKEFFEKYQKRLQIENIAASFSSDKKIKKKIVHRPGLDLVYARNISTNHIVVFGKSEISYLKGLDKKVRYKKINAILTETTPAVIISRKMRPLKELVQVCEKKKISIFRSSYSTMELISKLILVLNDELSPVVTLHGTLVEVFGIGVLIQGESSVGKSEAALGLIERGHRLISDDVVQVKKRENVLIGTGPELTRHLMEIRGIGIINVAHLYGATCVRPDKVLDIIVKLEQWDDSHFYDRVGLEEKFMDILDNNVPFHLMPIKPGRDVILLIETLSLNHRLKGMGYNSAKEFNIKLLETIGRKRKISENN